jgi:hypothetical protein
MNTGTGLSGSTDWNNGFRCRAYLETITSKDGAELDRKFRVFKGMKRNYGELGGKITLEWKDGLYVPVRAASGIEKVIEDACGFVASSASAAPPEAANIETIVNTLVTVRHSCRDRRLKSVGRVAARRSQESLQPGRRQAVRSPYHIWCSHFT